MPAQAPPRDRWRVVRAGLGLGLAIFALATVAAQVDAQSAQSAPSAPSGLPLVLAPETAPALLFALLLGLGIAGQVAGRYYASRSASLIGAALVIGAGIFERDPVLVVGQLVIVAALWPTARHGARSADGRIPRKPGPKSAA